MSRENEPASEQADEAEKRKHEEPAERSREGTPAAEQARENARDDDGS